MTGDIFLSAKVSAALIYYYSLVSNTNLIIFCSYIRPAVYTMLYSS